MFANFQKIRSCSCSGSRKSARTGPEPNIGNFTIIHLSRISRTIQSHIAHHHLLITVAYRALSSISAAHYPSSIFIHLSRTSRVVPLSCTLHVNIRPDCASRIIQVHFRGGCIAWHISLTLHIIIQFSHTCISSLMSVAHCASSSISSLDSILRTISDISRTSCSTIQNCRTLRVTMVHCTNLLSLISLIHYSWMLHISLGILNVHPEDSDLPQVTIMQLFVTSFIISHHFSSNQL